MVNNNTLKVYKDDIQILLLCIGLFFTQFYIWDSGLPQVSHLIIAISLIYYIFIIRYINILNARLLSIFICYVGVVNITWFLISALDISYIWSLIYWIFNYFLFCIVINIKNKEFLRSLTLKLILLSFFLEIIIYVLGLGRYNFPPRFNSFFNDPNQMAFWILCLTSIYIYLSNNRLLSFIIYLCSIFLILITLSRSALLGIPLITIALILKQKGSLSKKVSLSIVFFSLILVTFYIVNQHGYFDDILFRFEHGIENKSAQESGRGFNIPFENLQYLIFGAGQGRYGLYSNTGNEIHSTWLGILFYYGALGLALFIAFLGTILKRLPFADKLLFISPMLYGITTYSARNTVFWLFLGIFLLFTSYKATNRKRA